MDGKGGEVLDSPSTLSQNQGPKDGPKRRSNDNICLCQSQGNSNKEASVSLAEARYVSAMQDEQGVGPRLCAGVF